MSKRERFYEVFSRVNKIPLNEQDDVDAINSFIEELNESIISDLSRNAKLFEEGVPRSLNVDTYDFGTIQLQLDDSNGTILDRSIEDQLQYIAKYNGSVNDRSIIVDIPYNVDIENYYEGGRIKYYIKISHSPQETTVELAE